MVARFCCRTGLPRSARRCGSPRRVLHFVFGPRNLPEGSSWSTRKQTIATDRQGSGADERDDFRAHAGKLSGTRLSFVLRFAPYPIKVFDLDQQGPHWNGHLSELPQTDSPYLGCHWTAKHQAGLAVVGGRTYHRRRSMPRLLVSSLCADSQPDDIARFRNVSTGH